MDSSFASVQRWSIDSEDSVIPHKPELVSDNFYSLANSGTPVDNLNIIDWYQIRSYAMWRCFHLECGWAGQVP